MKMGVEISINIYFLIYNIGLYVYGFNICALWMQCFTETVLAIKELIYFLFNLPIKVNVAALSRFLFRSGC
jgi:hypothetical protein